MGPDIELREEPISALAQLASVPIAFEVHSVLDVTLHEGGLGGFALVERLLEEPYVKDYDAIAGEGPARWVERFDVSNWGLLAAYSDEARVGSAVIAFDTKGLDMLDGRGDLAVLWDLRVAPAHRRMGIGAALFHAAEEWAKEKDCLQIKVETQNINVPACRFYARQDCELGAIHRFAYPELPDEIQLLWYKQLPESGS